jgi:drug/metabolite transporter (DMT)-like permease
VPLTPGADLAVVGLGLASAAAWGAGDFCGGLASRAASVFGVVVGAQVIGALALAAVAVARAEPWPAPADAVWSVGAGLGGAVGLVALYRALALGRMGLAAPITAVVGAAVPVLAGAFLEGLPRGWQLGGIALALAGVVLVSRPDGAAGRPEGLGLALLSGLGFGAFFVLIDRVGGGAVFWPLACARAASVALVLAVGLSARGRLTPGRGRRALLLLMLAGVLDAGGNAFFLLATQSGRLDVAAVLASLYPAATVLLARLVLDERLTPRQRVGVSCALGAIPLIGAG